MKAKKSSKKTGVKAKLNWKNWKLIVVVLLVAGLGSYFVYRSRAGGNYTFAVYGTQMKGGTLVTKNGGTSYRYIDHKDLNENSQTIYNFNQSQEMYDAANRSAYICMHYLGGKGFIMFSLTYYPFTGDESEKYVTRTLDGKPGYMCIKRYNSKQPTARPIRVRVSFSGPESDANVQVDSFYGKPSTRSLDAYCNLTASVTSAYKANLTWYSKGIDPAAAEGEPVSMKLRNDTTGGELANLPLSGTREASLQSGVTNNFTLTYYEGNDATDVSCKASTSKASIDF